MTRMNCYCLNNQIDCPNCAKTDVFEVPFVKESLFYEKKGISEQGVKYCCRCNKVLESFPVTSTFYYYPGEGYYCGSCKRIYKRN
jgi:hypothetical protein